MSNSEGSKCLFNGSGETNQLMLSVYKILSKILVHRLQKFMNKIISANQSSFIKGRLISDNILVVHECIHFLKNKRMSNNFDLTLKLDMSKACDRMEWSFVWFIMEKLGFCAKWINWLKECVSTVSICCSGRSTYWFL